jgi:curved DNA-binding protein CbpA
MERTKDHYATLGVLPSIDDVALTAVCRSLLKKYHPDVAKGQNTDERAAEIIDAYRVLGNADLRKAYDSAKREITVAGYKQEYPRSVRMRPQHGLMRTLVTAWVLGFGMRTLVTACVVGFFATGPLGAWLVDALRPLSALNAVGDFNFRLPFSDAGNGGHNTVRHVKDRGVRDDGAGDNEVLIVKSEMIGSSKVIHIVKR